MAEQKLENIGLGSLFGIRKPEPVSLEDLLAGWEKVQKVQAGEEMACRLRALDERHQPLSADENRVSHCRACMCVWPCPDYVILQGGEVKRG